MRIHRIHQQQARRLWQLCLRDGRLRDDLLRATVDRLTARRPRGFLPVLHCLRHRVELMQRLTTARIASADPLAGSLRQEVEQAVRLRFPAVTDVVYARDPALLAGIRVQTGYDVMDDSLLGRLNRLRQKLQP